MKATSTLAARAFALLPVMAVVAAAQEAAAPVEPARPAELSAGGLAFMVLSLAFVWGLALFCYRRVLTAPPAEQEHIDTGPAALP